MAVFVELDKKLSRMEVIRTSVSHGWTVGPLLTMNQISKISELDENDIMIYVLKAYWDKDNFWVTYQPKQDMLTIVGGTKESEDNAKERFRDAFSNKRLGEIAKNEQLYYEQGLIHHRFYLEDEEIKNLIEESNRYQRAKVDYIM